MSETSICEALVVMFGRRAQMIKACEEMAELQQALLKNLNNQGNLQQIFEEMADVEIMLTQLKIIFRDESVEHKIMDWKVFKLYKMKTKLIKEGLYED